MRTSKPISTISYNDPAFLRVKLEELRRAKVVSEWYFIQHEREDDETKRHIHLYIQPSRMLQTDDLVTEFAQPDPEKPGKFLTCPRWVSSKFGDWYLYSIHDPAYLASKGEARKFHYARNEVQAYDEDALDEAIREIDLTSLNAVKRMREAQEIGLTFGQYFRRGSIPVQAVRAYQEAWNLLIQTGTERGTHIGHEGPEVDPETGEVK